MENIVAEIAEKFIKKIIKLIGGEGRSLAEMETSALAEAKKCAAELIGAYAKNVDAAIAEDKSGRREMGYAVERRGDERKIISLVGEITYRRTYYKKASGGYEYLADTVLGIEGRERVSGGLSLALAVAAKDMSYFRSSQYVSEGEISRQTVMRQVRRGSAETGEIGKRRKVPELHIDADEAHITLYKGKKSEVPLISIYEGIDRQGKRGKCRNIFHISEYGKTPDELWEQALTEIERRYDIAETKIYLHGDGAGWIQAGFEWIPDTTFVLDKYHKNKAIRRMAAGTPESDCQLIEEEIRQALGKEELSYFEELVQHLCDQAPERKETIMDSAKYLKRFVKGISICETDPRANNGGCTEPHVSHVLSARLSSRPMAWSKKTLKQLAPVLACGRVALDVKQEPVDLPKLLSKAAASASKALLRETAGLPHPDAIGALPLSGKTSGGHQRILRIFA